MDEQEKKTEDADADYAVFRGGKKLGTIAFGYSEFPWHRGDFYPTPEFEEVRPLLEELFLSPSNGSFEETWAKVAEPGIFLQSLHDGSTLHSFILHIRKRTFRLRILEPLHP